MDKSLFSVLIGKRIKDLREEKALTQRQLAFLANKDPQSLHRVENGQSCPTVFYLLEIIAPLNISLTTFFEHVYFSGESNEKASI